MGAELVSIACRAGKKGGAIAMSYILDALKKSEQERQRGTVPDLLTVQEDILQHPPRRFPWRYVAVAIIVLGAGVAARLLLPLRTGVPAVPAVIQEEQPAVVPVAPKKQDMPAPAPTFLLSEKRVAERRVPVAGDKGDTGMLPPAVVPERPLPGTAQPAPAPQDTVKPVLSTQQATLPPADSDRVYRLKELPATLQKALPSFSLSAFMYSSNPELRMVRINQQMMREGQEVTAGVRLQEITTDGVILASQGYRFFIAMK